MTLKSIDQVIQSRRVLVTCGTGGVGKTTVSSVLALRAAQMGRNALVITIDPAKRLKTSLGVKEIGDDPVDLSRHIKPSLPENGKFSAVIPDTKKTFEKMVYQLSSDQEAAQKLTENPIFKIIAKEFSGANEYMALQKLMTLVNNPEFETIILDTPPSRNMIAFLNAPHLLGRFFEEKIFQMMIRPSQTLVSKGMKIALDLMSRLTGDHFMTHLMSFLVGLFQMQEAFTETLRQMNQLLASSDLGFILVTAPSPSTLPDVKEFARLLKKRQYYFDGVILNRTLGNLPSDDFHPKSDPEKRALELIESNLEREKKIVQGLDELFSGQDMFLERLPELTRDIHSIGDLNYVSHYFAHDRSELRNDSSLSRPSV